MSGAGAPGLPPSYRVSGGRPGMWLPLRVRLAVRLRPGHMGSGPETRLVARIVRAIKAKWPEAWVTKIHGSSYQAAGIPDLIVIVDGRFIGLEVKAQRPGESEQHARGRATATQLAAIAAIRRAGGTADVVLSIEESIALIETAVGTSERPV